MKPSVVIRFAVIGALWVAVCAFLVVRMIAAGTDLTLLNLFPIPASGVIVFVPMYKKYVKNGGKAVSDK